MAQEPHTARDVARSAKEQAGTAWHEAKETARSTLGGQQQAAAQGIGEFAGALRQAARNLHGEGGQQAAVTRVAENVADGLERFSTTLRQKDLNTMVREMEGFARSQPALFFGAAVAAGFLAVRFLKSEAPAEPPPPVQQPSVQQPSVQQPSTQQPLTGE